MYKIFGAKGNIQDVEKFLKQIKKYAEKNKILIQVFNADLIYGEKHLLSAFEHAKRAIEQETNTTNSFEMEIILYASGERQLKIAIPKMGVKTGKNNLAFIFINNFRKTETQEKKLDKIIDAFFKQFHLIRDDKVLEGDIDTLKKFGLTKVEIETVTENKYQDLILEKIAMVDIIK